MAEFTCPKCGHRQPAGGAECVACGVVFAKVLQARQRAATGGSARPEARRRTSAARIVFLLLLVVLAVVVWRQASLGRLSCAGGAGGPAAATRSDVLVTGEAAPAGAVTIGLYDPIELDGMTRAEVEQLRTYYVDKHPELVREYTPSSAVFGQIVDGLPWWGVEGQFCDGPGERGIDGDSEEARWVINPFLLLGVDEAQDQLTPLFEPGSDLSDGGGALLVQPTTGEEPGP